MEQHMQMNPNAQHLNMQCQQMVNPTLNAPISRDRLDERVFNPPATYQVSTSPSKDLRKSKRPKKLPGHLVDTAEEKNQKNSCETGIQNSPAKIIQKSKQHCMQQHNLYSDFKCDHCGSRYVVNPMRRGKKISTTKYKAAPRHKVDPETQKILTLCNACGLKFGRSKKERTHKVELTEEDQKKFLEEGERFGKELAAKIQNENASILFCGSVRRTACGCIQKFVCGTETGDEPVSYEEIVDRAQLLVSLVEKASELKKMKCYDINTLELKPGKKNSPKIGLGNGHRKSKEFEDFVLSKRGLLRNELKLCEKAAQKILSYSNNFLHKRLKTDPEKGIRVERQKGKAALGMLKPIADLPMEMCCADNCVRMALTHGRLLEIWRERANSGQVEARRVLAEMLTPSGGNRANCYKFISWVTGCSNTTIGKVNEQMKSTGGDREPPEHGLKKYWRYNPKKKESLSEATFVPSYQILQTAATSAGLSSMVEDSGELTKIIDQQPQPKKAKHSKKKQQKSHESKKDKKAEKKRKKRLKNTIKIVENADQASSNVLIALNGNFPNSGGFISIPAGLTSENTITIPNTVSLQTLQQQIQQQQHQQQLQLQIQLLQQQLQNVQQTATIRQTADGSTEYIVTPAAVEQSNEPVVQTPVVVQTVTTPTIQNVVAQTLIQNNSGNSNQTVIPATVVAQANNSNMDFLTSSGNQVSILQHQNVNNATRQNISLVASPIRNSSGEISIIAQSNPGTLSVINASTPTQFAETSTNSIETYRQAQLITSQSQASTIAVSQPVTLSLQTPSMSLSTLPTMLLTQSTSQADPQPRQVSTLPTMLLAQSIAHVESSQVQQQQQQQTERQQIIIQASDHQQHRTSEAQTLIIQGALSSQTANQIIVHPALQTVKSNSSAENTEATTNTSSINQTSFNADAFLTNGVASSTTTYAVVDSPSLEDIEAQQVLHDDDEEDEEESDTVQVSFISSDYHGTTRE